MNEKMKIVNGRARKIKLLVIDTDGVLAKPFVIWSNDDLGRKKLFETKLFCIHDGSSCWAAKMGGLKIALVSGATSESVYKRAAKMKIEEVYLNRINKLETLEEILDKHSLKSDEVAYIGDDFLDLPIMKAVGLAVAVNDAVEEVKEIAHYVTSKNGGEGAVAETIRIILKSQNKWQEAMESAIRESYKPK